jgi:hypothetical protein
MTKLKSLPDGNIDLQPHQPQEELESETLGGENEDEPPEAAITEAVLGVGKKKKKSGHIISQEQVSNLTNIGDSTKRKLERVDKAQGLSTPPYFPSRERPQATDAFLGTSTQSEVSRQRRKKKQDGEQRVSKKQAELVPSADDPGSVNGAAHPFRRGNSASANDAHQQLGMQVATWKESDKNPLMIEPIPSIHGEPNQPCPPQRKKKKKKKSGSFEG